MTATGTFRGVNVLLATDADWLVEDIVAALGGPDVVVHGVLGGPRRGPASSRSARRRASRSTSGSSTSRSARWAGWPSRWRCGSTSRAAGCPHVPVLMLLDRVADVHLARRSGAEGWIVKPLDPLRLSAPCGRAGGGVHEGVPLPPYGTDGRRRRTSRQSPEGEPAAAG